MPSVLQQELRQQKPFATPEQEASLSVERTAAVLRHGLGEALKPFGVTGAQYNVLRILRGAGSSGLCRNEVGDRLVAQVPDVTRLLDRMEATGLITRERDTADRRMVTARITPAGLRLLDTLDERIIDLHRRQLGHLGREQLQTLVEILATARRPE